MDEMKVKNTVRRMTEERALLIKNNPFFGHLSMGLQLACAPCKTACTDGSRLIFDPAFAEKLSDQELQFVILHEVLHCVFRHCIRGKGLHSVLYNIACDIVVNSTILAMWGQESMMIAGEKAMHLAPDGKEGREYNAEEIYQMLIHQNHTNGIYQMQTDQNNANKSSQMQTNQNPPASMQTDNEGFEKSSFDRHDIWQGICDKAQLQDNWNRKIQSAFRQCGDSTGMPQQVRTIVQDIARRSGLNWKQLLHDFLQSDTYDYNFLPPDRRYAFSDFYLPAYNMDEEHQTADDIWVCIDTSGSVTEEELTCTMAEILDAMRQAGLKGRISFFDSNITEPEPFEFENDLKNLTAQGGGGTSFHIIFRYLKEKLYPDLPRAILIFTDGYARFPEQKAALDVPVLWLICKGGNADVPWGQVIQL
ncbi:DUF2201 family putative metallopeptidase [uncultured Eubacterium sp.]|uniref:vWA domain-containing protein n=1 Tax=uncultured Eubacterium sp. TaxID=165185 RepID=UPI0015AC209F|nr:VWA-like domain-containing protein [uncultured Eubacterium sp.]